MSWIKIETNTPEKPEIRAVARACRVSQGDAFLAFFKLYRVFDTITSDGFIHGYTKEEADLDAGLPGVGQVFEDVGWMMFDSNGCTITHWDRHNGKSAKQRAQAARRAAKYKSKSNAHCVT